MTTIKGLIAIGFALISTIWFDIRDLIVTTWFLMFVDTYLGVKKGNKNIGLESNVFSFAFWSAIRSRKLLKALDRGVTYLIVYVSVWGLTKHVIHLEALNFFKLKLPLLEMTAAILCFVEIWSIGEKFNYIYGINPIKVIFQLIKDKDYDKIEEILKKEKNIN